MDILKGFEEKGFGEQVGALTAISRRADFEAFDGLFKLYNNPLGDMPVDAMVEHTLRELLSENETETVTRLTGATLKDKRLCLQVAGTRRFVSVVPVLKELLEKETDEMILTEVFVAMESFDDPSFLEVYRDYSGNANQLFASMSVQQLGVRNDTGSLPLLKELIAAAEADDRYQTCLPVTVEAVEAVRVLAADSGIKNGIENGMELLVEFIHHKSPTTRGFILDALKSIGEPVLPLLEPLFKGNDVDKKIMAADLIGGIGVRKGAKILVKAVDQGNAGHDNVRFAVYEALGRIPSSKGSMLLLGALKEEKDACLSVVVMGLELHFSTHMTESILEAMTEPARAAAIMRNIVTAKAGNLFTALYENIEMGSALVDTVLKSNDAEVVDYFKGKLETLSTPGAAADYEKLKGFTAGQRTFRILAADDSSSMRGFYRSLGAEMDMDVTTAEDGGEALEFLEREGGYHLLLTDMNMPGMDGIRLTQLVRDKLQFAGLPIIMATTESDKSQVRLAKNSGVNDFITKPIKPELLEKKLKKFLKG